MAGDISITEWAINNHEREIRDLEKFWNDIHWSERDAILSATSEYIKPLSLGRLSPDLQKRRDALNEEIKNLLEKNPRPSSIRRKLHLYSDEIAGPDWRMCVHIIMNFMNENDLIELGKYLGINNIESFRGRKDDLIILFIKDGNGCSQSRSSAYSNYIGKKFKN